MYTSILAVALSGMAAQADAVEPVWLTSYSEACAQCSKVNKPMAVFFAPGKEGWKKVASDAGLTDEAKKTLGSRYVCVFIDTDTDDGKGWSRDFEIPGGTGLVISDVSGKYQAFRHAGSLPSAELTRSLDRYSSAERFTRTSYYSGPTETIATLGRYGPSATAPVTSGGSYYSGCSGPSYSSCGGAYCNGCTGGKHGRGCSGGRRCR